jgi:hypothetical protein
VLLATGVAFGSGLPPIKLFESEEKYLNRIGDGWRENPLELLKRFEEKFGWIDTKGGGKKWIKVDPKIREEVRARAVKRYEEARTSLNSAEERRDRARQLYSDKKEDKRLEEEETKLRNEYLDASHCESRLRFFDKNIDLLF